VLRAARALSLVLIAAASATVLGCGDGYPPALLASATAPTIRVRLGRPRAEEGLHITGRDPNRKRNTDGGASPGRGARPQHWDIRSGGGGAFSTSGAGELHTMIRAGSLGIVVRGRDTGAAVLKIRPDMHFTLGKRTYPGTLIVTKKGDLLEFVNELDMETYLAGVIPNEVGPKARPATYRAQAVTARTYAWMRLQRPGAAQRAFHLYDTAASQVYSGLTIPAVYGIDYHRMRRRVAETRGVIITYQGRPFPTYYASTCGGHTTRPEVSGLDPGKVSEPLRGVPCNHCKTSKYYRWTKRLTEREIVAALRKAKRPVSGPIHAIGIARKGQGGWAAEIHVTYGPKRSVRTLPGHDFRRALGLRSHNIADIARAGTSWTIRGRGWGHGVGMCQWGAIEMGHMGATETEILRFYYPGIDFTKVY